MRGSNYKKWKRDHVRSYGLDIPFLESKLDAPEENSSATIATYEKRKGKIN